MGHVEHDILCRFFSGEFGTNLFEHRDSCRICDAAAKFFHSANQSNRNKTALAHSGESFEISKRFMVFRLALAETDQPLRCLGMHVAVSEFARHVCDLDGANSTEMDPETPHPVIDLLPEQKEVEDLGGTMRLGAQAVELAEGTRTREVYGNEPVISERHRHRYEVNNAYRQQLADAGLVISGTFQEGRLVEIVELPDHPWFVASQFHPEFKSRPTRPAPLFREFVAAALQRARARTGSGVEVA